MEPPQPLVIPGLDLGIHAFPAGTKDALLALAGGTGCIYWSYTWHFQSTDDAFIAARQIAIAPKVTGYVTQVPVTDNQHIAAGAVIARIDDRDYRIALAQASAQVSAAQAAIQNIDAQIAVQQAQIKSSEAQVEQAQATLVCAATIGGTRSSPKEVQAPYKTPSNTARSCFSSRRPSGVRKRR